MELTKKQLESELGNYLSKENGLHDVLQMLLNALMGIERDTFLKNELNNKANGYRSGSVFGLGHQIELRIPRDRQSQFYPVILALFREQESHLHELSFMLYKKGLTTRDISDLMSHIYGKHYSKSAISNISQSFYEQMQSWRERRLEQHYLALYIDGLVVKVRRDGVYSNECFYIIMGLKEDGTREIVCIDTLPTESATGWQQIFEGLKSRGLESVGLIVSDSLTGIANKVSKEFPQTAHQLCTVHLMRNVMAKVRAEDKAEISADLREILSPDDAENTIEKALSGCKVIGQKWSKKYKSIKNYFEALDTRYFTYLNYPVEIRRMIYSTNWIERFNRSARRTLKVRGAFPNEDSVLALITAVAMEKGEKTYNYPIYQFKNIDLMKRKE